MILQRSNVYRILATLAGLSSCLFLNDGQQIFEFSAIFLLIYLCIDLRRVLLFLQIDTIWVVAFLAVVTGEGILDARIITENLDASYYDAAARIINVVNFCFLACFNLIERYWPEKSNAIERISLRRRRYWLILPGLLIAYFATSIPQAVQVLTEGRFAALSQESDNGAAGLLLGILHNVGLMVTPMIAYHILFQRDYGRKQGLALTVLACAPVILTQVAIGVRSSLFISLIGIVVIYLSRYPFGVARPIKIIGGALALLVGTTLMKELRGEGLQGDISNVSVNLGGDAPSFLSEGVVLSFAKMVSYFDFIEFRNGLEHIAVASFWIPRSLWPDKPFQLEYWFPRAYDASVYSEAHSIAATFAATAYVDFGFAGTCLIWAVIGLAVAFFNRWCTRVMYVDRGSAYVVIAAAAMGLSFYAVRQFSSIVILGAAIFIFWQIYKRGYVPGTGPQPAQEADAGDVDRAPRRFTPSSYD